MFIELTERRTYKDLESRGPVLINIQHIIQVNSNDNGSTLILNDPSRQYGNYITVTESFEDIKRLLGRKE
jgi:ABC-type metal ion transport system substrate-binding protein